MKKIKFISFLLIFFLFVSNSHLNAIPLYAPQAQNKPVILGAAPDFNGEIDLKWLNIGSSNDSIFIADTQSYLIYHIYRKSGLDFSASDSLTVFSQGTLIDTVFQKAVYGQPSPAISFWSDTSAKSNNTKYFYSIIAYDRRDGIFSNASDTIGIQCDTQGPQLISIISSSATHLNYVQKNVITITLSVYENSSLVDGNLKLNYAFTSDTNNLSSITSSNSVPMSVTSTETSGYFIATGYLPVSSAGNETAVLYWITGTDNSLGLQDEINDFSPDGNIRTSSIINRYLLDSSSAVILYIDAIAPTLVSLDGPDSYNGFIKGRADTIVRITVNDNMYIETGNLVLHYKKLNGTEYSIPMNYSGSLTNGLFSATLPVSNYSNSDILNYWITGNDKAGNQIVASYFYSEATGKSVVVDSSGPYFVAADIFNAATGLKDLSFSKNQTADSLYYFSVTVSDSVDIDSVYVKFYSTENNIDSTISITGRNFLLLSQISGDTLWGTAADSFIADGNIYPAFFAVDRFNNISLLSDTKCPFITQNYLYNSKNIRINSVLPYISSVRHFNNDAADSNTELSAGDSLLLIISSSLDSSYISAIDTAIINLNSKSLGTVSEYSWNFSYDSLILTLPANFNIKHGDTFIISPFIRDIYGNFADAANSKPVYDSAPPFIKSVQFTNNDTTTVYSTGFSIGDSITVVFTEPVDSALFGIIPFNNLHSHILINGFSIRNFGASSPAVWQDSKTLTFSIGNLFTVKDGDTLVLSNNIRDIYGNYADTLTNKIYTAGVFDNYGPAIISAYIKTTTDASGKTAYVQFSEPVDSSTLLPENFTFSNGSADSVFLAADSDKCYVKFTNIIRPGIDSLNTTSGLKDYSIKRNSAPALSAFQIADLDSPFISAIYIVNNDTPSGNTQISVGDTLIIVFSEPMKFTGLNLNVFHESFPINGGITGDTYGNFSFYISSDSRELHVKLGEGMTIEEGDTINPSQLITDLSGNPDISANTYSIRDMAGPVIIDCAVMNNDTALNSILSAGDKITLYFSEPMNTAFFGSNPDNVFLVNGKNTGSPFGSSSSISFNANGNTAVITLSSGFTVKTGDTISIAANMRDLSGNYADSKYSIVLKDTVPPYLVSCYFQNSDTYNTAFSAGDILKFKFSEPVDSSFFSISNIIFGRTGDTFGAGSQFFFEDSTTCAVTLNAGLILNNGDTFGISGMRDFYNNSNINAVYPAVNDTVPAIILSISFTDADTSSDFSEGDSFAVIFSEPMDSSTLPNSIYGSLTNNIPVSSGRNFGSNSAVHWTNDTTIFFSLSSGFSVVHNDAITFTTNLKDKNNIGFSQTISAITLKDTAGPRIISAYLNTVIDSYCRNIYVVFNVSIDSSAGFNPLNFSITSNYVDTVIAINNKTLRIKTVDPVSASLNTIIINQNIKDDNGANNQTISSLLIIDTTPPVLLKSIINPADSNDTTFRTVDLYFNEAVGSNYSLQSNYPDINLSATPSLIDPTIVRLYLTEPFVPHNNFITVRNIKDFADSNSMSDSLARPLESTMPYLKKIVIVNNSFLDTNTALSYGDTIILYFSESINTSLITTNNIEQLFGQHPNAYFGDSASMSIFWSDYFTVLKIMPGQSAAFIYPAYINPLYSTDFVDLANNKDSSVDIMVYDNIPPDAPTSVILADTDIPLANPGYDNDNTLNLIWNQPAATDIDSYAVYISINYSVDSLVGFTRERHFSYSNLTNKSVYYFKIKSIDRAGNYSSYSVQSAAIISDMQISQPSKPVHTDVVLNSNYDTDNIINFQWSTPDTDIIFFAVYIDSGAGFIYSETTVLTTHQVSGVYRFSYAIYVKAIDIAGNTSVASLSSDYITVDTGAVLNPGSITHSDNATAGYDNDTSLSFSWNGSANPDFGFFGIWYNFNGGNFVFVDTTVSTSYNLKITLPGAYRIKIYAYDIAGNPSPDSSISAAIIVDTSVAACTLVSPLQIYTNTLQHHFEWTYIAEANTYIFQMSSDSFSTIKYETHLPEWKYNFDLTLDSGHFQWRVITLDNAGNTNICNPVKRDISIDTKVNPPLLIYPQNNFDTENHFPTCMWSTTDADTYIWYFGVDTGAGFKTIDYGIYNKTITSDTVYTRMPSDTYYWYVYVQDIAGNTNVSEIRKIILRGIDYFFPINISDKIETSNLFPRFSWERTIGADTYYIFCTATDTLGNQYTLRSQPTAETSIIINTAIPNIRYQGDTIYWYVYAVNSLGDTNRTVTRSFLIDHFVDLPDSFFPANKINSNDTHKIFYWSSSEDAVSYRLQFARDTYFRDSFTANVTLSSSSTSFDSYFEQQGDYFWRLIATDRFSNSDTSAIFKFTIDYFVGKTYLIYPQNNSFSGDVTPVFQWLTVIDAETYQLQVSEDTAFSQFLVSRISCDTSYSLLAPSPLKTNSYYYWRVITYDTAGNLNTSDIFKIIIDSESPVLKITSSSSLTSGYNYTLQIVEKNLNYALINVNNETIYFNLNRISDTVYICTANISTVYGLNRAYIYAVDKVGLFADTIFNIYQVAVVADYNTGAVYSFSDTEDIVLNINSTDTLFFGVNIKNSTTQTSDTIKITLKIKNNSAAELPLKFYIDSRSNDNFNSDTMNPPLRFIETKNSIIDISIFDRNDSLIENNENLFDNVKIEFMLNKNLIESNNPRAYKIFTYAKGTTDKWYDISDENMPGGKRIIGDYIYSDTSISAYIKHFSIYGFFNISLFNAQSLGNVIVYPNPFVPFDGRLGTGLRFNTITVGNDYTGGICFGIDNNSDGTIDNGLPQGTEISIFTLLGEKVASASIAHNSQNVVVWDGLDNKGSECASGLYIAVIRFNGNIITKKIAIVR